MQHLDYPDLLPGLSPGELLLLGARPGQGKTLLALNLLRNAAREGRRSVFFTLDNFEHQARQYLRAIGAPDGAVQVVAGDAICADAIVGYLAQARPGTIAVVDYLQVLGQDGKPPLLDQLAALQALARERGIIFVLLSQIDPAFDPRQDGVPALRHVRQPDPIPGGLFSKACFLHEGKHRLEQLG